MIEEKGRGTEGIGRDCRRRRVGDEIISTEEVRLNKLPSRRSDPKYSLVEQLVARRHLTEETQEGRQVRVFHY